MIKMGLQSTADGQRFQIHSDEMLVFASDRALAILAAAEHWFADGTFSIAPPGCMQLYTIQALIGESTAVPCVFALLKDKSASSYAALLACISDASPRDFTPQSIMVDFETAAISTFRQRFPRATLTGCFYHLARAVGVEYKKPDCRPATVATWSLPYGVDACLHRRLFLKMMLFRRSRP